MPLVSVLVAEVAGAGAGECWKVGSVKGIVFTEFLEMLDEHYPASFSEDVISNAHLLSGGAYTAVGTYPHQELIALVNSLARASGTNVSDLYRHFGEHMFQSYLKNHGVFFNGITSTFDLLAHVENYIHKQVKKLYPDAKPPHFDIEFHSPERFTMVYRSPRPFGDLCEGLIMASVQYFGETVEIHRTDLKSSPETCVRFDLVRSGQ